MKLFKIISNNFLIVFLIILLFCGRLVSQQGIEKNSSLLKDSVNSIAIITPPKPVNGDKISIKFLPSQNSEVKDADSLFLDVLFLFKEGSYIMQEYLMNRDSVGWSVDFVLDDDRVGCMAFQFSTPDFSKVDCNNRKGWDLLVYNRDGIPIKGAFSAYANGYMTHGLIRRNQDMDKYKEGKLSELKTYPEDPLNLASTWYFRKWNENLEKIKREIDSVTNRFPTNVNLLEFAYNEYSGIGDTLNLKIIFNKIIELDPNNPIAIWRERSKIFFNKPDINKLYSYQELIKKSKERNSFNVLQRDYFQTLYKMRYYEQAAEFFKEWEKPDFIEVIASSAIMLNDCFYYDKEKNSDLISKILIGDDEDKIKKIINLGIYFSKAGISGLERMTINERDNEYAPHHWLTEKKRIIGFAYSNLGFARYLLNDSKSAKLYYDKARNILGKDFYSLPDSYYLLLIKKGEFDLALEEASKALKYYPENKEFYSKIIAIASKKRE